MEWQVGDEGGQWSGKWEMRVDSGVLWEQRCEEGVT